MTRSRRTEAESPLWLSLPWGSAFLQSEEIESLYAHVYVTCWTNPAPLVEIHLLFERGPVSAAFRVNDKVSGKSLAEFTSPRGG